MRLIEFKEVSKSFFDTKKETKVLNKLSFSLDDNEKIAIVGPSGCGKSTILNLASDLIKQDQGEIIKNGNVGYMFQTDNLFEWRSVYKNIVLGLEVKKKNIEDYKEQIEKLLKKYDLWEFKDKYPSELSGGMRQRVALIRTLILDPDILLLDEPFSALDAQTKILVNDDIYKIVDDSRKSVIMVTHDIAEAIAFSNRVIVLSKRPATIKKIYNIDFQELKNRTPLKARSQKEFKGYFDAIWRDLNES
jgi:NitT/TauT family transport system ATP-binding protein